MQDSNLRHPAPKAGALPTALISEIVDDPNYGAVGAAPIIVVLYFYPHNKYRRSGDDQGWPSIKAKTPDGCL
jgi:hypothetical protein